MSELFFVSHADHDPIGRKLKDSMLVGVDELIGSRIVISVSEA